MMCCAMRCYAVLCSAMLCCTMLYYAVLCCAVLCCAVLCYSMLFYAVLCCAVLCYAVLCYAMLCYAMQCYAMQCYAMLCYAVLCYAILCYSMLCYAMLCYAMLCYAMLCCGSPGPGPVTTCTLLISSLLSYVAPLNSYLIIFMFMYMLSVNFLSSHRMQLINTAKHALVLYSHSYGLCTVTISKLQWINVSRLWDCTVPISLRYGRYYTTLYYTALHHITLTLILTVTSTLTLTCYIWTVYLFLPSFTSSLPLDCFFLALLIPFRLIFVFTELSRS